MRFTYIHLQYADDCTLFAHTPEQLQEIHTYKGKIPEEDQITVTTRYMSVPIAVGVLHYVSECTATDEYIRDDFHGPI